MRLMPLALAFALPLPAVAQDTQGTITGTLDLDPANWTIVEREDGQTSSWRETDQGYAVTITGYPDTNPPSADEAITITFRADAGAVEPVAENAEVTLSRTDGQPLQASGENIDFSLTAFEVDGPDIAIAGNLVATMTPGGSEELVVSSPEDVIFDGNFQATIPRAE